MTSNKCFVVLAPNGRRQNVKVTPNTTILQVLEEVCTKQGFKPEEYDIKHHKHVLDTTQTIRFSGLPNNALLEMTTAQRTREEKSVVLGLQLESGDRIMGDFLPTDSLWDVIKKLCPKEADPDSNPVIIYMRREVYGLRALQETTLRSLGLTGGRAMLRFVHRTPEELHRQANVSAPLPPRPVEKFVPCAESMKSDAPPEHPSIASHLRAEKMDIIQNEPETSVPPVQPRQTKTVQPKSGNGTSKQSQPLHSAANVQMSDRFKQSQKESMDVDLSEDTDSSGMDVASSSGSDSTAVPSTQFKESYEEIILLGARNAVAFSLEMAQAVPYEDLPDDFFELTLEDARAVYRDLKRRRAEMEEAPLATSGQRSLQDSKRVLNQLHQYRRTVIRIQFPDRTVLQGTFLPLETVSMVMDFVRGHLENPETEFHLYTTPPKQILPSGAKLIDAGCVPSAVVHFGTDDQNCKTYLSLDILTKFSSPSAATVAACQSRGIVPLLRPISAPSHASTNRSTSSHAEVRSEEQTTTTSQKASSSSRQPTYRQEGGPSSKVPKWFKPIK